jgi:excisionase family DNA binding protein
MSDLARAIAGLPDDALLPVKWIREHLGNESGGRLADLTVQEVGEELGRAASTIRTWAAAGRLPGAYRLRGREWRVPPEALRSLRDSEWERVDDGPVDLGRWREVASSAE